MPPDTNRMATIKETKTPCVGEDVGELELFFFFIIFLKN